MNRINSITDLRDAALCDLMMALNVQRNRFETATVAAVVRDALTAEEREALFWILARAKAGRGELREACEIVAGAADSLLRAEQTA